MSNDPDVKPIVAVATLFMMVYSMPSR